MKYPRRNLQNVDKKLMRTTGIVKYSFSAVGILMFLGAIYFYLNTHNFLNSAITTNGTVIDIERSVKSVIRSTRTETSYRPVIAFKTENGGLVEFTSATGSNKPGYTKGEVVEVLYQESIPQEARISSFFSLWGMTVILAALGAVFFGIGFSTIILSKRK